MDSLFLFKYGFEYALFIGDDLLWTTISEKVVHPFMLKWVVFPLREFSNIYGKGL